ncbi:hypothetical protein LCGC14_1463210 [marine sediment metagenome]|uniref:Uncharacterized protein n=1 Tax=marine sediment metagenome TaxID=412755 RepID=A0A0F9MGG3_9ZZZZ
MSMRDTSAADLVRNWNSQYPVGTKVILTNDTGGEEITATRSQAWVIPSGPPLVSVEGRAGGYLLTRIKAAGD